MSRLTRYILRQLGLPVLFISVALVGVVWLTQSLRFVDLIVNRGLSASHFLYLTVLLLPGIFAVILPVALLCGVLFTYHRLSFDSEIIVMKAAGLSQRALAVPAIIMALIVTIATYGLTLYLQPLGFRTFKDQQFTIRHNYASVLIREGTFNNVIKGVTVYVRERHGGELLGILVHDSREPEKAITVMAERGTLVQTAEGPRFVMENGNRQERHRDSDQLSLLYFDRYTLDLALIAESPESRWREPGERYISELLFPGDSEAADYYRDKLRAEAHKRFVSPLYCIAFVLIALAAILSGEFDRRYEWRRILYAAAGSVAVQVVGISLVPIVATTPGLSFLLYLNIILASCAAVWMLMAARRRKTTNRSSSAIGEGVR
ncbi:MAG: LPS export ABC transporter permease LptF [Alphaproteobacteria bacterium]|nr:LPS export ABC transporter permease LptF [Alphaproteobacteria bacterium]|tara:strand:- start:3339 stop:4466 length:1128 start_codon:yes stop_codon:yes gene_type:complete